MTTLSGFGPGPQWYRNVGARVSPHGMSQRRGLVVDGWRSVRMHSTVGKRSPAHATAIGKVLLSGLPDAEGRRRYAGRRSLERRTDATVTSVGALLTQLAAVREQGCAFDTAELEPGLHCIAAPVRDHAGAVIAAAGISGPADRITDGTRPTLAASVRTAAEEISARMGAPNTGSSPA